MKTATNGSDVCYHVFFEKVRWAVESPNIKVYICKGPSSSSHVLVFACRASALKGRGESRVFHAHAAWFHLLLWDARQQDLWSVLQGQRVCAVRLQVCMEPPDRAPDYWNCAFPHDLAGPKGVNCLCRRPKTERSSTSAHFLPWTFSCTWKRSWRLWSAATTPTCTHGLSVWKITVRNSQIQHTQHILHFTFSM